MLAALGLADMPQRVAGLLSLAAGFTAALALLTLLAPQPGAVGILVALAAGWRLLRPGRSAADATLAGACAGAAAALYAAGGVNLTLSVALAAGVLGISLLRPFKQSAQHRTGRDLILLLVAPLAAVAGLLPDFIDGWHSAGLLNAPATAPRMTIPAWALAAVIAALLAGLFKGAWIRR